MLKEKLGDLLLQVVFHCSIEDEESKFGLDDVVDGITDGIIDISGIKTRHDSKFGTYTNIKGFTSDVNVNDDTNYKVIYTYDLNTLSDNDINNLGINRDLNTFKTTLTNRGLTCK